MRYNNPGLIVDLGVGLWANPLPMDLDGDGKLEMVVASMGKPERGIYRFEPDDAAVPKTTFKPGVRFSQAVHNLRSCQTSEGRWVVLSPGKLYTDIANSGLDKWEPIPYETEFYTGRANHWSLFDYDGDGIDDLIIGADDWREYGWDDAYNEQGRWTNGPLRGYVWWVKNTGTNALPKYTSAEKVLAGDIPVETYGNPCPSFADFTGDGLPDLICGEFLDKLTFYENVGSRQAPAYSSGRYIEIDGRVVQMELEMIVPIAVDWDGDGYTDLIVGQEDGRVALMRHTGRLDDGMPVFDHPVFFKQLADEIKVGALSTPSATDWDGDSDIDLVVGDTAGFISFLENLGGKPTRWAAPVRLRAEGKIIRVMAGENGSIQGPAEAKWGYSVPEVADWDGDGLPDLLMNNILGRVIWYKNIGSRHEPKLAEAQPVLMHRQDPVHKPAWNWWEPKGDEFVTQWRSSVQAIDLTDDGVLDMVALDQDGFLSLFVRREYEGKLKLDAPRHVFHVESDAPSNFNHKQEARESEQKMDGTDMVSVIDGDGLMKFYHRVHGTSERAWNKRGMPAVRADVDTANYDIELRLTAGWAGRSGRRKFVLVDWDMDGRLDLLVNSVSANFMKNISTDPGKYVFKDMGPIDQTVLAGHTSCPEVIDLNANGTPDIVVGAEDGYLYQMLNPYDADTQ